MILLCSRHHRLVHEGGYRVESLGDQVFVFYDRAGRIVPEAPPPTAATGPSLADRHEGEGIVITKETCRSLGGGEAYDLGAAIDVLVTAEARGTGKTERSAAAAASSERQSAA
jgi:hypothetical protein